MVKIQEAELLEAIRENNSNTCTNWGFCLACGSQQEGCEPDARRYECEDCGKRAAMPQDVGHTTYYDTERLPYGFKNYRFLASGNANWDYFLSPTCPWVYSIAKQPGCLSGSWGALDGFLLQQASRSPCADYLLPLGNAM